MDRSNLTNFLNKSAVNSPRRRLSLVQSLKKAGSNLSISARTNQSTQIICRTASHLVENFGSTLPVLVTEALTFLDRNTAVSVGVSDDGWAWLVCGRRLLVWQCKQSASATSNAAAASVTNTPQQQETAKQRRTFKTQCRELLLPQSDLAHKAECIVVWTPDRQQVPCCMAVSPEGTVRYWPSIANEELSSETSAELAGQEVDCLAHLAGHGCVLATTTCTVALLQPQTTTSGAARGSISCRVLRTSPGWLGGIGRRMSSLFFGTMPQSPVQETKLIKVICNGASSDDDDGGGSRLLILAGTSLQYWSFVPGQPEKMEFDEDISHIVTQSFQRRLWELNGCNSQNMNTWLIDMQPAEDGMVILMACHCPDVSPQIHFAVGLIPLAATSLTMAFKWFIIIKIGPVYYEDEIESVIHSYRFVLAGWEIVVYNHQNVIVVGNLSEYEQDKIDLTRGGEDRILGGALCAGTPVLFTKNLGLIAINSSDFTGQEYNQSYSDVNASVDYGVSASALPESFVTLITNEEINEMYYSSDCVKQLQAAFLFSVKQNKEQCDQILNELFPLQEEPLMEIDAVLDTMVLKVAKHLIDDYPANDPRWENHRDLNFTLNAVLAMQIAHQLEGKQRSMDLFVAFLKEHSLWTRLSAVSYRSVIMFTTHILGEYAEKLVATLAIYNLQQRHAELIDAAIERALQPEPLVSDDLSSNDVFYREVSQVQRFFPALVDMVHEQTQSERPVQQMAEYIARVNSILLGVLHEIVKYRQYNSERYSPPRVTPMAEYLSWTAAFNVNTGSMSQPGGCLDRMRQLTLLHGVGNTGDVGVRNELYEQLVGLVDLILDGRKCHLESLRGTERFELMMKKYEAERAGLIQPLIKDGQYESAAQLAEKYCDFGALIQICELTDNKSRIDTYMERYAAQDFAGFLFQWYVKDGRQGQLFERCRRGLGAGGSGASELTAKLLQQPTLSWVQAALSDGYPMAARTLRDLAKEELELVARKKSMLSLAKLAYLASDEPDEKIQNDVLQIDYELNLIAHQEDVPVNVLEIYGYDVDKLRVLSAAELINLYTCAESHITNEYDYKKALDLLDYIEQEDERSALRSKVWARAARCDTWEQVGKNPELQVQETIFFKLMDLVHMMGNKVEDMLPPMDCVMTEAELGELSESNNFQYLIKLIYEYAYNNY